MGSCAVAVSNAQIRRVEDFIRSCLRLSSRDGFELSRALADRFSDKFADFEIPGQRPCRACGRPLEGRKDKIYCDGTCRKDAKRERDAA